MNSVLARFFSTSPETLEALVDETSVLSRSVEGALKRAEEIQ